MDYGYEVVTHANDTSAPSFLTIGRDYLAEIMLDRPADYHERFLQSLLHLQNEPDRWLILLKHEGECIGFTHAKTDHDDRPGWGYVLEFYIAPSARRQGLGRLLYEHIAGIFRSNGLDHVWLAAHPRAEQFWHSLGFRETGEFEGDQKVMIADIRPETASRLIEPRKIEGWEFFNEWMYEDTPDQVSPQPADPGEGTEAGQVERWFIDAISGCRRVLDLGCGPGWPGLHVAPHVGELVGIDAAPRAIAAARADATRRGIKNASFEVGGANGLPYGDGEFDGIMLCGLLMSMDWESVHRVMAEVRRVAAPGARIAALDQDWQEYLARVPTDQVNIRLEKGRLFLQVIERTTSPHAEVDTRYIVASGSPTGKRLIAELGGKTRISTSIRPDDLIPADVLDATRDVSAQFDRGTYAELFRACGFSDVKCESVLVPDWGDTILFLTAKG